VAVRDQHVGDLAGVEAHPFDVRPVLVAASGPAGVDQDQPATRVQEVEGDLVVADVVQGVLDDLEWLGAAGVGRLSDAGGEDIDVGTPGDGVDALVLQQCALCRDVPDGQAVGGVVRSEVVDRADVRGVGVPVVAVEDDEGGVPFEGGVRVIPRHGDPVEGRRLGGAQVGGVHLVDVGVAGNTVGLLVPLDGARQAPAGDVLRHQPPVADGDLVAALAEYPACGDEVAGAAVACRQLRAVLLRIEDGVGALGECLVERRRRICRDNNVAVTHAVVHERSRDHRALDGGGSVCRHSLGAHQSLLPTGQ
jgi:hypothetical protein